MGDSNLDSLWRLPLFSSLTTAETDALSKSAFVQIEPADAILFRQGESPRFLHVILSGSVALFGTAAGHPETNGKSPPEREAIVEIFGAGDVVIAPAVILDLPYLMSARVVEPSRIAFLPAGLVRALFRGNAGFAQEVALMLARHWRLLARQLKDQKLRSTTQRFGSYLMGLAHQAGEDQVEFELPFDRRTIASWLGTSPESLSRAIAQLSEYGVQIDGRKVRIGNISRLSDYCLEDDLR